MGPIWLPHSGLHGDPILTPRPQLVSQGVQMNHIAGGAVELRSPRNIEPRSDRRWPGGPRPE